MLVNKLFFFFKTFTDFFWGIPETGKTVDVYENPNQEETKSRKIVAEIDPLEQGSGKRLFKVNDFEMDPQGSELIIVPIILKHGISNDPEVMIFQEDAFGNMKLLTSIPEILQKSYGPMTAKVEKFIFLNYPSINLKYVSEKGLQNLYLGLNLLKNFRMYSAETLKKIFIEPDEPSSVIRGRVLSNFEYTSELKRSQRERLDFEHPTYLHLH